MTEAYPSLLEMNYKYYLLHRSKLYFIAIKLQECIKKLFDSRKESNKYIP